MRLKIYYGWWVVVSLILVMLVHSGTGFYVFGIFYKPLIDEFGWNFATISGAISIYLLTLGLTAPLAGKLTDRFGAKRVILFGALVGGAALFLLGYIKNLWQFYFLYFVLGACFSACGVVPVNSTISNWFSDKRGMAIGIAMSGASLGALFITITGEFVMSNSGWRTTYHFLAIVAWLFIIPTIIFAMENTPEDKGLLPYRENIANGSENTSSIDNINLIAGEGICSTTSIRTASYILVCISFFLIFLSIGAVLQHEVNFILDLGFSKIVAASALGLTGALGGLGKLSFGFLADKMSPKNVTILSCALQAFGIVILLFAKSMTTVWVFVVIFGFSMGGQIALQPLIIGELFGLASFGRLYGIVSMSGAFGTALGPVLAGVIYNYIENYFIIFSGCVLITLLSIFSFYSTKQQKASI